MDLKTYLDQPGQTQEKLAEKIRNLGYPCTQGTVSQWYLGDLTITAERAVQIEKATEGAIQRHELRPDLFEPPKVSRTRSRARA